MFYIIVLLFLILFLISIMYRKKSTFNTDNSKYNEMPLQFYKDGTILYLTLTFNSFNPRGGICYVAVKSDTVFSSQKSFPSIWVDKGVNLTPNELFIQFKTNDSNLKNYSIKKDITTNEEFRIKIIYKNNNTYQMFYNEEEISSDNTHFTSPSEDTNYYFRICEPDENRVEIKKLETKHIDYLQIDEIEQLKTDIDNKIKNINTLYSSINSNFSNLLESLNKKSELDEYKSEFDEKKVEYDSAKELENKEEKKTQLTTLNSEFKNIESNIFDLNNYLDEEYNKIKKLQDDTQEKIDNIKNYFKDNPLKTKDSDETKKILGMLDRYNAYLLEQYEPSFIFQELKSYKELKKNADPKEINQLIDESILIKTDIDNLLTDMETILNNSIKENTLISESIVKNLNNSIENKINYELDPITLKLESIYKDLSNIENYEAMKKKIDDCMTKIQNLTQYKDGKYVSLNDLKAQEEIECFANRSDGFYSYKEQKEKVSNAESVNLNQDDVRQKWWNKYKKLSNDVDKKLPITRQKIIDIAERKLSEKNFKKNNVYIPNISSCQPNFYKEHIKIGAKKIGDNKYTNFKMFDDNGNGKDILSIPENSFPNKKQEFKDDLDFVIDKKNLRGFYNINSGSSEVINTEFSSKHKSDFIEIDEISSIKDYHNYQLSKKDNVKDKTNYLEKGYNEKDLRFKNKGNIKNDNNNNT